MPETLPPWPGDCNLRRNTTMSATYGTMPNNAPMYLDDRLPGGYVVVCADAGAEHTFMLRRFGPSIECPKCGRTALPAGLLDAYYGRASSIFGKGVLGCATRSSSG